MIFRKLFSNRNEVNKSKNEKANIFRLSILEISKTLMYGFWCDYMKPKYNDCVIKDNCDI